MKPHCFTAAILAVVVLMSLEVEKSESKAHSWTKILNFLPDSIRAKAKIIVSMFFAYLTSKPGKEIENMMDVLFDVLPNEASNSFTVPPGEMNLKLLGSYVCWGRGKVEGVKSLEKLGLKVKLDHKTQVTSVVVTFRLHDVVFTPKICGYWDLTATRVFKCRTNVESFIAKMTFRVRDLNSLLTTITNVVQGNCMFDFVDFSLVSLRGLKMTRADEKEKTELVKMNFSWTAFEGYIMENTANLFTKEIRESYQHVLRMLLYVILEAKSDYVCRDKELESNMIKDYPTMQRHMDEMKNALAKDLKDEDPREVWETILMKMYSSNYDKVCAPQDVTELKKKEKGAIVMQGSDNPDLRIKNKAKE